MKKSLYLFFGDEDFLIDEEIEKLKRQFSSVSVETIDGSSLDVSNVLNIVMTPPIFEKNKFVVVKDFYPLISSKDLSKEDLEIISESIKNLPKEVTIVFTLGQNPDKRKSLYNLIESIGTVKEFRTFSEWEQEKVLSWIIDRVKSKNKKIGSHAANLLIEISGKNLRTLSQEIEKLITYIGEREWIVENDVRLLASFGEINAFLLSDAVKRRDTKQAVKVLSKLLENKEEPVMIISLLANQMRMLLQVKALSEDGLNAYEIADRLKANRYFVMKLLNYVKNFSFAEIKRSLQLLHSADVKIKTGIISPNVVLEMTIMDICKGM